MFLHRCQNAQIALYPAVVVVGNVVLNHLHKLFAAGEPLAVISLSFQNAPETFHWTVVNALGNSGHTLLHLGFLQLVVEHSVCVLKTSVAVEQRMCVGVGFYSGIQGVKY